MPWNDNLAGTHLDIAAYPGDQLRVVAGPGTGKTFALMRRVARLLEQGVQPDRILAVTFTRTAANDLVEKLSTLGVPRADQVVAQTLHSLCFGLLGRNAVFTALGRAARPLMAYDLDSLLCDLADAFNGKKRVGALLLAFASYWARLQHQVPGFPTDPEEQRFDRDLTGWLRFHGAMLIGEVVPLTLDFVRQNPAHPDIPTFEHVLVDEYQDLNRAEQVLIDALARNSAVTIIGDEDQSIYSFKHAHPEGIVEYPQGHGNTHDELLTECRRCPRTIVQMANALIAHNARAVPKVLTEFPQNGNGTVYIVQHDTISDEIETLALYIDWYLAHNPALPAGEVLVLANRRIIGNGIRDSLNALAQQGQRAWSAQSFYFEDSLSKESAAEGFALLTLFVDPEDRPSLRFLLGLGSQNCLSRSYAKLRTHCEHSGLSPKDALQALIDRTLTLAHTQKLVARYTAITQQLVALAGLNVSQLVDVLFPAGTPDSADVREAALLVAPNVQDAKGLLSELKTDIVQPELPGTQGPSVRIMSLHNQKDSPQNWWSSLGAWQEFCQQ